MTIGPYERQEPRVESMVSLIVSYVESYGVSNSV